MEKVERHLLKARQAIQEREWDKAKQIYLLALGLRSDAPDVHYGLATVYFHLKELTSAAHHFREVTRLDPRRAGAFVNLGAVLNLMEQYDEAINVLRRAIQLDPKRTEAYYNLGLVYRRKGEPDMAVNAYRETIRINPRMADAYLNLANLYLDKGQYRQAVRHYEDALKTRPNWAKALDGLAHAKAALSGDQPLPAARSEGPAPCAAGSNRTADLKRPADPVINGRLLQTLHETSISTEEIGRVFADIVEHEVEPAIKELSTLLLYPDRRHSDLEGSADRFENALARMHQAHQAIKNNLGQLRELSERYPKV